MKFHQNHITQYIFNSLYNDIRMRWKWQGAKGGSTRDVGSLQDQDSGFYNTRLNSVSSQCARGKPSIARKPEETFKHCNPPDFKIYPSKLTDKIFPHMV